MSMNFHDNISLRSSMVGIPQQMGPMQHVEEEREFSPFEAEEGEKLRGEELQGKSNVTTGNHTKQQTGAQERQNSFGLTKDFNHKLSDDIARPGSLIDNSSLINFKFQNSCTPNQKPVSPADPRAKKKQFVENMRKMVDLEYKQYVKGEGNHYTKGSLRTILGAIGEKSSASREADPGAYNLQNLSKAMKTMRFMEEEPGTYGEEKYL